jgi:hypothetical protein
MIFEIRRTKFANPDLRKEAERVPSQLLKSKKRNKNIQFDELGALEGRIHVEQENIRKINLKKMKSLNRGEEELSNKRDRESTEINDLLGSKKKQKTQNFGQIEKELRKNN